MDTNTPTKNELIKIAKEVLHTGFGSLPKNTNSVLTHYYIVQFLDSLEEKVEEAK